ncbi:MAG: ABC transporter permease [Betaproteobacteria bacterium RIFCSPLOWO2_12_FULL_66_14]|nr:MAG: ABC transporter permease [Betaproteobacteria bacterium RIFCSPLOWO2_12_FULL_66_14]
MKRFTALLAAATLAGATGLAFAQDIRIAHIYGKTGPFEAYAKQTQAGLMLGLEYATGGSMTVLGRKIVVIEKDDQLKADVAKSALAQAYGDDKADLAIGPTSSGSALAMLPVAEEYKKILLVEPAVADSITGDKWNRYVFRTGRSSSQDGIAAAVATPQNAQIAMLAQDYAFGRDGVKAYKDALAAIKSKAQIVHEEYVPQTTTDFTAPAQRMFDVLKDKPGTRIIGIYWAGANPVTKLADLKPERFNISLAPGGNILPVMKGWKNLAGLEGAIYYYYGFPKNKVNDWMVAEYRKRYGGNPPDFFVAGGMAAGIAAVEAIKKARSTDSERLISAMEGMSFETPKGYMTFRKEDHQAMQDMYQFRIKKTQANEWDLLDLVREIPAREIPLPIRNKR